MPGRRRGRIWPWIVLGVVVLVVVAGAVASNISLNDYVITPGDATPVSQYIEVPPTTTTRSPARSC